MTVSKYIKRSPSKRERISNHIEELKRLIHERFPDARFEVGPVPESRWPGLWVTTDANDGEAVREPLRDARWEFFARENMNVHVIVDSKRNGDA